MKTRDLYVEIREEKITGLFGAENLLSIVNVTYYTVETINGGFEGN